MPDQDAAAAERPAQDEAPSTDATPWADAIVAAAAAGIGLWVWVEARGFPAADEPARDPGLFPLALACLLWACAFALLARFVLRWLRGATPPSPTPDLRGLGVVGLVVLGLFLYAWAAFEVGYLLATWVFLTVMTLALGGRSGIRGILVTVAVAVAVGGAIWLAFVYGLGVTLPATRAV